jgi:A/G-specific adenine glycosylase
MALAREHDVVTQAQVEAAWPGTEQRERCLDGLVDDGLLTQITPGRWALPG